MAIGLATPTIAPLLGLKLGGANTGGPVYGVGSWPAGVPSGITVGAASGAAGGGANGSAGGKASGSTGGGGANGSAGGGTPNGMGGGGAGCSIGCESMAAGSGLTSGSAQADGLAMIDPP